MNHSRSPSPSQQSPPQQSPSQQQSTSQKSPYPPSRLESEHQPQQPHAVSLFRHSIWSDVVDDIIKRNCDALYEIMQSDKHFHDKFDITSVRLNADVPTMDQYKRMNKFVTILLAHLVPKIKNDGDGDHADTLRKNMRHFATTCINIFNPDIGRIDDEEEEEVKEEEVNGNRRVIKKNTTYQTSLIWQARQVVVKKINKIVQLAQEPKIRDKPAKIKSINFKGGSRKLSKKRSVTYRRRVRRRNTHNKTKSRK